MLEVFQNRDVFVSCSGSAGHDQSIEGHDHTRLCDGLAGGMKPIHQVPFSSSNLCWL